MAINIRWTGIEQYKYGLTARWYVSAYYGNDIDVDGVGYYNPSANPTGHGGPTRPFASIDKLIQDANVANAHIIIVDSGSYTTSLLNPTKALVLIGDGNTVLFDVKWNLTTNGFYLYNVKAIDSNTFPRRDCYIYYGIANSNALPGHNNYINNVHVRCAFGFFSQNVTYLNNNLFIYCSGFLAFPDRALGNFVYDQVANTMQLRFPTLTNKTIVDYNIVIGKYTTIVSFNGKTTNVTKEDVATAGTYFVKSYSEVDLFGNASGSGASVAQLQTLFNNYFSPIYIDTWQDADFSLKPTASDFIKFGGLNGSYIGALPVGYRFSASELWNTYKDALNTSNIDYDMVSAGLVIADGQDVGTYRSIRISLPKPITCNLSAFFANLVYNVEGTVKQGVANQRIDTTVDMLPDNTVKQRVVYDYKLSYAPNNTDPLSAFKNFELNRTPWIDASGRSMLDELYVATERQSPVIQDFIIEFTLRKVIID